MAKDSRPWTHLKTISDPFEKAYWCPEEDACGLCDERRRRETAQYKRRMNKAYM